jgi:hypothetical protein
MSSNTALHTKWHSNEHTDDGVLLRHTVNGVAWKAFDSQYHDFASNSHNVKLGLASDGFNSFSNMSITYSI